jgi:PAS domain S-box-containing protein
MSRLGQFLDPTRSVATAVGWLAAVLSLTIAALTVWGGNIARYHLLAERDAVLSSAAETLAGELDQALSLRLQSLESLRAVVAAPLSQGAAPAYPALRTSLERLKATHPEFEWIALADAGGRFVAQAGNSATLQDADASWWAQRCVQGAWFGEVQNDRPEQLADATASGYRASKPFGLCTPIVDGQGQVIAWAAAELPQSWLAAIAGQVRERLNGVDRARAMVLDEGQRVLVDNRAVPAQPGVQAASTPSRAASIDIPWTPSLVAIQRLDDGKRQVVVRAPPGAGMTLHRLGLQVIWLQPTEEAVWQGGGIQQQIAWISLGLSVVAALIGFAFARRLTRRLTDLTAAVKHVGTNSAERIAAPHGKDEVSELGRAFSALHDTMRQERDKLNTLAAELEQRVQARTGDLRQQARYLRTLIDMLPMRAWFKDTASRYLVVNGAHAQALGHTVEGMAGKSDLQLLPPLMAQRQLADDVKVMASRRRKTTEEHVPADGSDMWVETFKAPVLDEDGTVLGTVGVARNISERKAVEFAREAALDEAKRLVRLRSEFLAHMSHELRTPLNGILGFAQILQTDKQVTEHQRRGLGIIEQSGRHLLTLITEILDLASIDAAKLDLYPTEVDLPVFLQGVDDIVRVKAEEKRLRLVCQVASEMPAAIRVDEKRLRQVLLNLLSNAVKFTDAGDVTLHVTRLQSQESSTALGASARLRFEVQDNGIGMSEAQLARLFQPFEQVSAIARHVGGTGLGLAISSQLIRLMGGDIRVRSRPGEGSVFWFEIEVQVLETQPQAPPPRGTTIGYEGRRRKVLVVDDVPHNREMLLDALGMLGFEMVQASDGEEAVDLAAQCQPDLIVMDLMMLSVDGYEATRRIRRVPELASVPIIAASASVTPEVKERCRAAGADAFICKPIERDVLTRSMGRLMGLTWIYEQSGPQSAKAVDGDEPLVAGAGRHDAAPTDDSGR